MIAVVALPVHAADTASLQDYAGKWVLKYQGKNLMVITLQFSNGHLSGNVVSPKHIGMEGGEFARISSEIKQEAVPQTSIVEGHLRLTTGTGEDDGYYSMTLTDHDHAELEEVALEEIVPTKKVAVNIPFGDLQRVNESEDVAVATSWPAREPKDPSKEITALQSELKQMVVDDQAVRETSPIDWTKMEEVDKKHYPEIVRIYEHYGWPRIPVVEAAQNYWLLVQHQKPEFQQKVLPDLKRAVDDGEASKTDYAYLYDRVMVGEGKPQHWGTQGGACKDGKSALSPIDDPAGLAERRKELHLTPIDQYMEIMNSMCAAAGGPPTAAKPQQ